MISPEFCVAQARLARWRNRALLDTIATFDAAQRRRAGQGGSASLAALCAGQIAQDHLWLSRLDAAPLVDLDGLYDDNHIEAWDVWRRDRQHMDARIHEWATRLTRPDLEGELFWYSAQDNRAVSRPYWVCVSHVFTQQAETRGRINAELARLGLRTEAGDLLGLPHDLDWM